MERLGLFSTLTQLNPKSLKELSTKVIVLVETRLWAKVLAGMILGIILGLIMSSEGPLANTIQSHKLFVNSIMNWLALPAQFFLKVIQMVIIPLIIASVIRGLASTDDLNQMKRIGLKFSFFVFFSSILATIVSLILTYIIKPGAGLNLYAKSLSGSHASPISFNLSSPENILNILPVNPLASIVEGQMLDVVILSIIFGIALLSINVKQAKGILDLLEVFQQISMNIISWAMKIAPFAVFGMMANVVSNTGLAALKNMSLYVLSSYLGFILFVLLYLLFLFFLKGYSPLYFIKVISSPLLLAFSTSSSAATMPLTMKVAEEDLKANPSTARFLIPLGTTINMAGSAIWHTTAVIFIGQAYNINLGLPQILFVIATSIGSSIGSPGVPGVGIGILSSVLAKIGIPIEGVSLILGVDRLVDMGCTVVNVTGDLTATAYLATEKPSKRSSQHKIQNNSK